MLLRSKKSLYLVRTKKREIFSVYEDSRDCDIHYKKQNFFEGIRFFESYKPLQNLNYVGKVKINNLRKEGKSNGKGNFFSFHRNRKVIQTL